MASNSIRARILQLCVLSQLVFKQCQPSSSSSSLRCSCSDQCHRKFWLEQLRKLGNNDPNEALKVALDDLQIITDLDDWLQEVKLSDPVNVGLGSKDIAVNVVDADCV